MTQMRIFACATVLSATLGAAAYAQDPDVAWRPHVTYSPVAPPPPTYAVEAPSGAPCGTCQPAITPLPVAPAAVAVTTPVPAVVYRPILDLAPTPPAAVAGQGILGQPKLYVPGQPVRNFFRYISP